MTDNKKIFYINSRNRLSGSDSDFQYVIDLSNFEPTHCVALQVNIPKSYYVVQDGKNTFVMTEENVNAVTVPIPAGNYNRTNFRVVISTLLNSYSPNGYTYTVTYPNTASGTDTGKYTFLCVGHTLEPSFTFEDSSNIYETMGFDVGTTAFVSGSLTSTNVIKLTVEDSIFIHSDLVAGFSGSILQEIFAADSSDFSNIVFENYAPTLYEKKMQGSSNNTYRFWILNENGQPINLNGLNWSMTLVCYQKDNLPDLQRGYIKWKLAQG